MTTQVTELLTNAVEEMRDACATAEKRIEQGNEQAVRGVLTALALGYANASMYLHLALTEIENEHTCQLAEYQEIVDAAKQVVARDFDGCEEEPQTDVRRLEEALSRFSGYIPDPKVRNEFLD